MSELMTKLGDRYGAHAFGVASVIALWLAVVRPSIQMFADASRATAETVSSLQYVTDNLAQITEDLRETQIRLENSR